MDASKIAALLDELKLRYQQEQVESDLVRFEVRVDEAEDLSVTALLYSTEDGDFVRLLAYVDEVDRENESEQLRMLLALNGELPMGAYCMDPDEEIIFITANLPADDLDAEYLGSVIEFMFVAQEIYDEEISPDAGNGEVV